MPISKDASRAFMPYPAAPVLNADQGPLVGLSFGVKDLFNVAGYPTGVGNPTMLAWSGVKSSHASAVDLLLQAGARFAGKTQTEEFAFSIIGSNAHFGAPINGAAPERFCGGSSSGSVSAVSNLFCDFALGTDTGGSVRAPASHCALFGLRPTHAAISLQGCWDLAPELDTCGFFTRDLASFERIADVLFEAPADAYFDPMMSNPSWLIPRDAWALVDPGLEQSMQPLMDKLSTEVGAFSTSELALDSFGMMCDAFRFIQADQAWQSNGALIEQFQIMMGPGVEQRLFAGRDLPSEQLAEAQAFRQRYVHYIDQVLGANGVMVLPTMPAVSPLRSQNNAVALDDYRWRAIAMLSAASLAGLPQMSLPLGWHDDAPIGLSMIGPRGSDRALIALARQLVSLAELKQPAAWAD